MNGLAVGSSLTMVAIDVIDKKTNWITWMLVAYATANVAMAVLL